MNELAKSHVPLYLDQRLWEIGHLFLICFTPWNMKGGRSLLLALSMPCLCNTGFECLVLGARTLFKPLSWYQTST